MNIIAITQARVGSSRLPAKVLKEIGGKTLLQMHLEGAMRSRLVNKVVVATTMEVGTDQITTIAEKAGAGFFQGALNDVLDRYYQTANAFGADWVVRITSDCPLIDGSLMDEVIQFALEQKVDYASNVLDPSFPDGQDVEVFRFSALEKAWKEATLKSDREHVTAYIWRNSSYHGQTLFSSANYVSAANYNGVRLTVDEQRDFEVLENIINTLGVGADWETYAVYYQKHAGAMTNTDITRNEGYLRSLSGEK